MALTITHVQTYYDTDNQSIYNTDGSGTLTGGESGSATYTLVAGRHYFISVASHRATGGQLPSSVVFDPDGTPLTFDIVTDGTTEASTTSVDTDVNKAVAIYHKHVSSTTATSFFRITYAATQSNGQCIVFYVEGENDTGLIVQVVKGNGTSTSPAVTMASFGSTDNGLLLLVDDVVTSGTDDITATESRTELAENLCTESHHHADHYQFPNGGDTTVGATLGASHAWWACGIELKASAAASFEQEGFRFRADDGSETTATWLAGQDTSVTRESNTNTRLRANVNATGDAPSQQYQLEYRRQGGSTWLKVGPPPQDA